MFLKSERLGAKGHPFAADHEHSHDEGEDHDGWAGARQICAPPLRHLDADLQSVWDSITNGTITVISSDHAPSRYAHHLGKRKPIHEFESGKTKIAPSFATTPNGLPGIETRLPLLFSAATDPAALAGRRLSLPKFVELTSSNPAKMYGLGDRKGGIAPGYDADIVIWYPSSSDEASSKKKVKITNEMLHHSIDYTPFEGFEVINWPRYVLLRGEVKWDRDVEMESVEKGEGYGKGVLGKAGDGRFLKREKGEVLVGRVGIEPAGMRDGERESWL